MNRQKTASGLIVFALLMVVNVPAPQSQKPASAQKSIERPTTASLCIPAQPMSCRPGSTGGLTDAAR